mmetsp:Transcript_57368/g.152965  ORF Transcript_57368/g.152965 Transcript_57368/m.152965 type:complete len:400 (-) Transcript_57368:402-1601(-)
MTTEFLLTGGEDPIRGKGSTFVCFLNFFKSLFGTGFLSLPHAFAWGGLWGGVALSVLATILCGTSLLLLLDCQRLSTRIAPSGHKIDTYQRISQVALGSCGYVFTVAVVVILELAFCTGWVIVSADQLHIVTGMEQRLWVMILFPFICVMVCIRFLKDLWVFSLVGLLTYVFGVIGGLAYFILSDSSLHWHTVGIMPQWPKFLGVALYSMEAILLTIPTQSAMRKPEQADLVIASALGLFAAISCGFGALGYAYGFADCAAGTVVVDCMPQGAFALTVRLFLAGALIVGVPILLWPVNEVFVEVLFTGEPDVWKLRATRVFEAFVMCVVASMCTNFAAYADWVGAIVVPIAGFLLPSLLHFQLSRRVGLTKAQVLLDVAVAVFGLAVMTTTVGNQIIHG